MKDYKLQVHAVGGEVVIKAIGVGANNHVSMTMNPTKALELSMALMRAARGSPRPCSVLVRNDSRRPAPCAARPHHELLAL